MQIVVTWKGERFMGKGLKFAVVSAIFLFAYPHSALSENWNSVALPYEEAVWKCSVGDLPACEVMYRYDMARSGVARSGVARSGVARSGVAGGRPADPTMLLQDRTMPAGRLNGDSTTPELR